MRSTVPIAVFLSSFEPSAATRYLVEAVTRLDRGRFDVSLACVERRGRWLARVEAARFPVTEFPVTGFHHASAVTEARRFARWCREREIAIVHAAGFRGEVFALPAAAFASVPTRIATRLEVTPGGSTTRTALRRAAYACAQKIVVPSAAVAAQLVVEYVPARRVRIIPQAIDASGFRVQRFERPLRRVAVQPAAPVAAGLADVFRAVALVARKVRDLEVVFDARLACRDRIVDLAREHGVVDRVRLEPGSTAGRLASADLVVAPGGLGADTRPVLEAMASGLPVVACRGEDAGSLIDHQRTGVLVPPGDAQALAWAVLDLVQWPAHARALGTAACAWVERHHRLDTMVAAFERLYLDGLQGRHAVVDQRSEVAAS